MSPLTNGHTPDPRTPEQFARVADEYRLWILRCQLRQCEAVYERYRCVVSGPMHDVAVRWMGDIRADYRLAERAVREWEET